MHDYELVTIISPEVDEERISSIIDELDKFISDRGGIVDKMDNWGKRKLAYPIKKFMEGNYVLTRFKLEPKLIEEVEAKVKALEEVLRHLVVKVRD
jgi:small subunit ribosomal protein S6